MAGGRRRRDRQRRWGAAVWPPAAASPWFGSRGVAPIQ